MSDLDIQRVQLSMEEVRTLEGIIAIRKQYAQENAVIDGSDIVYIDDPEEKQKNKEMVAVLEKLHSNVKSMVLLEKIAKRVISSTNQAGDSAQAQKENYTFVSLVAEEVEILKEAMAFYFDAILAFIPASSEQITLDRDAVLRSLAGVRSKILALNFPFDGSK